MTLPVHFAEHQGVEALPSIAAEAGDPAASDEAEAVPGRATFSAVRFGGWASARAWATPDSLTADEQSARQDERAGEQRGRVRTQESTRMFVHVLSLSRTLTPSSTCER